MKTGYKRFDIWNARLAIGEHPIVIISNWKFNMKSKDVNVCIITSQVKSHPSHVIIEGFGLKKVSQVKCDNIYTVPKLNLKFKIGEIDSLHVQNKIEKALKMQLQVDGKYNNNKAEDLEEFFINSKLNNTVDIRELAEDITFFSRNNMAEECIKACNILISNTYENEYAWHGYYHLALQEYKLKHLDKAIITAKESLKHLPVEITYNYTLVMFLLANCYRETDKYKAIKIYYKLAIYYKKNNHINLRVAIIYNIADLLLNKKAKLKLIKYIENTKENNIIHSDLTKSDLLEQMYREL